jgi:hypothetical protein
MEIEAQRAESPEGHLNGRQIREAKQAAKRRADQEIKEGRYQRMRHFPVLLDTRSDILYAGATQPAVLERLYPLFKETFGKRLEPITSGALGFLTAERAGRLRAIESIEPSRFVRHPERNGHSEICWTAHDSNSRDYLGNEFLMWLWYTLAEDSDTVSLSDKSEAAVLIARQLTLECPWAESGKETISCDSPTRLPEARRAIQSGKLPRKLGLTVSRHGSQYELTLQAETFHVSGAALPKDEEQNGNGHRNGHANGNGNGNGNGRAKMENRVEQVRHLAQTIDLVYDVFLQRRFSSDWNSELNRIATWLRKGE